MKTLPRMLCGLALSGCASVSQIMPFGQETYTVSASSEFGLAKAKTGAIKRANKFCSSKHKSMEPIRDSLGASSDSFVTGNQYGVYGGSSVITHYDLVFKCK